MASNYNKKGLGNQLLTTGFILQPPNRLSLPPIVPKHKQYPESTSLHTSTQLPCIAKEKPRSTVTNNCVWSDKRLRHGRPPLSPRKVQELAASINNPCAQLKAPTSLREPLQLQINNMKNIKKSLQKNNIFNKSSARIQSLSPSGKLELSPQTGGAFGYNLAMNFNKPSAKNNDMNVYKRSPTPGIPILQKKKYTTEIEEDAKETGQMHHLREETLEPLDEPISDEQRIEMRQKLRQEIPDYLVNFTPADSTFNTLVKKFRGLLNSIYIFHGSYR